MNRTVKHIIGCLATLAMIVVGAQRLGHLVRPVVFNLSGAYTKIDSFHSMPEHSIEVIAYGSSHTYKSIDPMVMYRDYGIGAYNYGYNWQRLNTTKLFLQESLSTQSPKIALIETYFVNRSGADRDMNGEIYYTRYLRNSKYKLEYLKQCFGNNLERWLSYIMPLSMFHDNWPNVTEESFAPVVNRNNMPMGFGPTEKAMKLTIRDQSEVKQRKLKASSIAELDTMVQFCREHNIEPVFFTVPFKSGYSFADAMTEYAREKGCVYINMFDHMEECGLDPKTDFRDAGHTNSRGAAKISAYLGKYLSEHYDLTDMRQVENNPWSKVK